MATRQLQTALIRAKGATDYRIGYHLIRTSNPTVFPDGREKSASCGQSPFFNVSPIFLRQIKTRLGQRRQKRA